MERKNTKKKGLIIFFVILSLVLLAGTIGGVYAYWAGTVNSPKPKEDEITIKTGEAKSVETILNTDISSQSGEVLVPSGQKDNSVNTTSTPVELITRTIKVTWDETEIDKRAQGTKGVLHVALGEIQNDVNNLIQVKLEIAGEEVSEKQIELGSEVEVVLTFTMKMPESKDEYNEIINKEPSLTLTLTVDSIE